MRKSLQILDNLIFKLETNLGKQHRFAPAPVKPAIEAEEVEEVEDQEIPSDLASEEVKESSKPATTQKQLSYLELWSRIDIRVGRLAEVWKHPESTKLYCEKIDIGEPNLREIASGLQEKVSFEDMTGLVLIMANLKARKLAGFNSNGMVLCATSKEGTVALLRPPEGSQVGEKVALESEELPGVSRLLPTLNPKHKVLEQAMPFLQTNAQGIASFSGQKLRTSAGFIESAFADAHIS